MPQNLQELTEQALQLPADDRVTLAESLLLTIDEDHDQFVDEAIIAELQRRLQGLRDGTVTGIPAEEVMRKVREALKSAS